MCGIGNEKRRINQLSPKFQVETVWSQTSSDRSEKNLNIISNNPQLFLNTFIFFVVALVPGARYAIKGGQLTGV